MRLYIHASKYMLKIFQKYLWCRNKMSLADVFNDMKYTYYQNFDG